MAGQSAGISWKGNALTLKLAALAMMPQDSNHQAAWEEDPEKKAANAPTRQISAWLTFRKYKNR